LIPVRITANAALQQIDRIADDKELRWAVVALLHCVIAVGMSSHCLWDCESFAIVVFHDDFLLYSEKRLPRAGEP
jgi:hypothetical protein